MQPASMNEFQRKTFHMFTVSLGTNSEGKNFKKNKPYI